MKKKPIVLSNLAMRFYIHDGWTKEELDSYCIKGEVKNLHPEDTQPYYTLNHEQGSAFDADKLAKAVSYIEPCWFWTDYEKKEFEKRTTEEVIRRYNW